MWLNGRIIIGVTIENLFKNMSCYCCGQKLSRGCQCFDAIFCAVLLEHGGGVNSFQVRPRAFDHGTQSIERVLNFNKLKLPG